MMKESGILRLLFVTHSGNTTTFNSSLLKIISMVLFESENNRLTADDIRRRIQETYELEFTGEEIEEAIGKSKGTIQKTNECKEVIEHGQKFKETMTYYSLDQSSILKFKRHEELNLLTEIVERFAETHDLNEFTADDFKRLIERFLYNTFNANTNTLLLFLRQGRRQITNSESTDYSEEEKEILNKFLNWNDKEKDEYVFLIASFCVEYCMMTVKKDHSSYKNVFKGKVFYLDSNVVFRLAGINNSERKEVMTSFIKKCKDTGITIKYTNFTMQEIKKTIQSKVRIIRRVLSGNEMVSFKNVRRYYGNNSDVDFFKIYDEWSVANPERYNDYGAFESYILKRITEVLRPFKMESFSNKRETDTSFSLYFNSLERFKRDRKKDAHEETIETDVNNYLYVNSKRHNTDGGDFSNISSFLISTDASFCEWNKETVPATIPVVVLPSVWHSLMLKFQGRSDDDYRAFSLFLNLRYKYIASNDKRMPAILSAVHSLDASTSVKDMILDDIYGKLTEEYKDESDISLIISRSSNNVIDETAARIAEEKSRENAETYRREGQEGTIENIARNRARRIYNKRSQIIGLLNKARVGFGIMLLVAIVLVISIFGFFVEN